eukprot:scaffold113591_cov17-Tisochrysis_lutea.AAC.1
MNPSLRAWGIQSLKGDAYEASIMHQLIVRPESNTRCPASVMASGARRGHDGSYLTSPHLRNRSKWWAKRKLYSIIINMISKVSKQTFCCARLWQTCCTLEMPTLKLSIGPRSSVHRNTVFEAHTRLSLAIPFHRRRALTEVTGVTKAQGLQPIQLIAKRALTGRERGQPLPDSNPCRPSTTCILVG